MVSIRSLISSGAAKLISPKPGESGVLSSDLASDRNSGDTIVGLGSDTLIMPREAVPSKPSFNNPDAIIKALENSKHQRQFELSGGGGFLALQSMVRALNGKVLSDGSRIEARSDGARAIITLHDRPYEIGTQGASVNGFKRDLARLESAIRSPDRCGPLKISVPDKVDANYVRHLALNLRSIIGREGAESVKIIGDNAAAKALSAELNGRILSNGKILRVSELGELYTDASYRLGENGWSKEALQRDFQNIARNAREAGVLGVKLKVWLNPQELTSSEFAPQISAAFRKLRISDFGDSIDLRTNKQYVDKIPGFIGIKHHVARFERDTPAGSDLEEAEARRCQNFISSDEFRRPLVVWIKRDTIGNKLADYLKRLKSAYGEEFHCLVSPKFKADHPKLMAKLSGEKPALSSLERVKGAWGSLRSWGSKIVARVSSPAQA